VAVLTRKSGYNIAECFRVQSEGVTPVTFMRVLPGTVIERVTVRIETPGTGVANLTVGDEDDADAFILAADHTAAAGSIYGDATTERGVYLYDATSKGGHAKLYNAEKDLRLVLSAAGTVQGIHQVFITGYRYDLG